MNLLGKSAVIAAGFAGLLGVGALLAQASTTKNAAPNAAAVGRGKTVFQQKCSVCHYDNSDQKKIGPGLKGLAKRGTFSVNGNKITDESPEDVDRERGPVDAAVQGCAGSRAD